MEQKQPTIETLAEDRPGRSHSFRGKGHHGTMRFYDCKSKGGEKGALDVAYRLRDLFARYAGEDIEIWAGKTWFHKLWFITCHYPCFVVDILRNSFSNSTMGTTAEGMNSNIALAKYTIAQCRICNQKGHLGSECVNAPPLIGNDIGVSDKLWYTVSRTPFSHVRYLQQSTCGNGK